MLGTGNGKRAVSEAGWPRSRTQNETLRNFAKEVLEERTRRGRAVAQLQKENCEEKPGTPSKGDASGTLDAWLGLEELVLLMVQAPGKEGPEDGSGRGTSSLIPEGVDLASPL